MGNANQKTTIDTHTDKKKENNPNAALNVVMKLKDKRKNEEGKKKDL